MKLFGHGRVDFGCSGKVCMSFVDLLLRYFIDFQSINASAVLIDYLYNIFQELLQTFALELKTDQVPGIVSLRLE